MKNRILYLISQPGISLVLGIVVTIVLIVSVLQIHQMLTAQPDLAVDKFAPKSGASLIPGSTIGEKLALVVSNVGDQESSNVVVDIYISDDADIDPAQDQLLGEGRVVVPIPVIFPAQKVHVPLAGIVLPPRDQWPADNPYIGVFLDPFNSIREISNNNNQSSFLISTTNIITAPIPTPANPPTNTPTFTPTYSSTHKPTFPSTNTLTHTPTFTPTPAPEILFPRPVTITGRVWRDANANRIPDSEEIGLESVTVRVVDGLDQMYEVQTDGNGLYSVSVVPGRILIEVDDRTVPDGYALTTANDPTYVDLYQHSTHYENFGFVLQESPLALITGRVLVSENCSAAFPPTATYGLANVYVRVTDGLGYTQLARTDANGHFSIVSYGGWTTVAVERNSVPVEIPLNLDGGAVSIFVPSGETGQVDCCLQLKSFVAGTIWRDDNLSGTIEPGEGTFENLEVIIADGQQEQIVRTDRYGRYGALVSSGLVTIDPRDASIPAGYILTTANDPASLSIRAGASTIVDFGFGFKPEGQETIPQGTFEAAETEVTPASTDMAFAVQ